MASGILELKLLDARGLKDVDFSLFNNKIDPYVVIQYRSQEHKSNVAEEQGGNPTWNQLFKFRVHYHGDDNQHKLLLKIMDHDTFSKDDFLGQALIHVSDLIAIGVENGFSELQPTKYSVVLADGSYCGEIRVAMTFTENVC